MAKSRGNQRKRYTVSSHPPTLEPHDVLTFIELDGFADDLGRVGLTDLDYQTLQLLVMMNPESPLIPGGGGLRKIVLHHSC